MPKADMSIRPELGLMWTEFTRRIQVGEDVGTREKRDTTWIDACRFEGTQEITVDNRRSFRVSFALE
jgi:hypothetical protein